MSSADEMTIVLHLARTLGVSFAYELADALGLQQNDMRWITPAGIDVTDLCDRSATGVFSSEVWTLRGWVLDQPSLDALMAEFPDEFA